MGSKKKKGKKKQRTKRLAQKRAAKRQRRLAQVSQRLEADEARRPVARPADSHRSEPRIDWGLATTNVPTEDWLDGVDLDEPANLAEAIDLVASAITRGDYLTWEAVIAQEQGLPLSAAQSKQLESLISFADPAEDEEPILYINELARPHEPWYETVRRLAKLLLQPVIRTDRIYYEGQIEGWRELRCVLGDGSCAGLSLPSGVTNPWEVVPAELSHRLDVQVCLEILVGLGQPAQDQPITLRDSGQRWRLEELLDQLEDCRDSVASVGLTLQSLRELVLMPQADREVLEAYLREELDLTSDTQPFWEPRSHRREERVPFQVGDTVRVKPGVMCPDYEGLSLAGWHARVFETDQAESLVGLRWDSLTLAALPRAYIQDSQAQMANWAKMYLYATEVEPAEPRDTEEETEKALERMRAEVGR